MQRVITATIFLSITLLCIILGGWALYAFLAVLMYTGTMELVNIFKAKGADPCFTYIMVVDFFLLTFALFDNYECIGFVLTAGIIGTFLTIMLRKQKPTILDTATTALGILFSGWLPIHIMFLRKLNINGIDLFGFHFRDGLGYILLIFFVISISDIAAYYIGKSFGKTPLWPRISPKKTVEGAMAGTIGGVLAAILVGNFIGLEFYHSAIAGLLLSLTAQLGDLAESMLKRDAGVKDSGTLIPGHGGVLDRADSYLFTGAVAYYYFKFFVVGGITFSALLF